VTEANPSSQETVAEIARNNGADGAFTMPGYADVRGDWTYGFAGLTKRELFAAKAMQALLTPISGDEDPQLWSYEELAKCAVKSADALLKELAK